MFGHSFKRYHSLIVTGLIISTLLVMSSLVVMKSALAATTTMGITTSAVTVNPLHVGAAILTTAAIRVRSGAGATFPFVATQPAGVQGVIIEGPVVAGGDNWFKVDYATGIDGWSAGPWLRELTNLPDLVGTLVIYKDGSTLSTTLKSIRVDALALCKKSSASNPKAVIRCIWRGVQIYDSSALKQTPNIIETSVASDSSYITATVLFGALSPNAASPKTPVEVGTIDWGDGTEVSSNEGSNAEIVSAVVAGTEVTVQRKHVYRSNGIYTITATGLDGKTSVKIYSFTTLPTPAVQMGSSIVWGDLIHLVPPTIGSSTAGGTYPRLVKIGTGIGAGDLLLFYQSGFYGGTIWMDRSHDGGHTWVGPQKALIPGKNVVYGNSNVIQLADGRLLMTVQRRTVGTGANLAKYYFIDVLYSSDGGQSWSAPAQIFQGMNWEARPIQVPHDANADGNNDIYVFLTQQTVPIYLADSMASSGAAHGVGVAFLASYDNGKTWTNPNTERYTARIVHRNYVEPTGQADDSKSAGGMPSPFIIGINQVAFVAEDINKAASPYVVATDPGDWDWTGAAFKGPWTSADYDGTGDNTVYPNSPANAWTVAPGVFGAAPFGATLPDGRIIVAMGSNHNISVLVGDVTGHNFVAQPLPFTDNPGIWPYIAPISDNQIIVAAGSGASDHFVNLRIGTIKNAVVIPVGLYKGFKNGQLFIQTQSTTRADALKNCQTNIAADLHNRYRCIWNDAVILDSGKMYENPKIAAVVTFVENKVNPIVYGTASGTATVSLVVSNGSTKVFTGTPVTVLNGKWSQKVTTKLINGSYSVVVYASSSEIASRDFAIQIGSSTATSTPKKNVFSCGRTLIDSYAVGNLGCYGMAENAGAFGGESYPCGTDGSSTIGCVIATKVCTSGTAKATAYLTGAKMSGTKLSAVSARLQTTPDVVRSTIFGLWEYTCVPPAPAEVLRPLTASTSGGKVLGAATDVYANFIEILLHLQAVLAALR